MPTNTLVQPSPPHAAPSGERAQVPPATAVVLGATIVATGLQQIYPEVLSALRRSPGALASGEWWRIITPLFVHSDGWVQIVVNLVGIALVGPLAERLFGTWRWLALYFITGVIAELISYAWEPYGAGASIALCGLIGGLLVWLFKYDQPVRTFASLYIAYLIAGLVGYAIGGFTVDLIFGVSFGGIFSFMLRRPGPDRPLARALFATGLLGAVVLAVLHDNHGPALLVGMGLAALMLNDHWR